MIEQDFFDKYGSGLNDSQLEAVKTVEKYTLLYNVMPFFHFSIIVFSFHERKLQ